MAGIIELADVTGWIDPSTEKLVITQLDDALSISLSTILLASLSGIYDVSAWTDPSTTPSLVKKILGMQYIGWLILRIYAEDEDSSAYAEKLIAEADTLIAGLTSGAIAITDIPVVVSDLRTPSFYPNGKDLCDGPVFKMGEIW